MNDFNAFLMPFSFLRRWSYDELIPALLYFDRVTFLMDDIEAQYISDKYQQPGTPPVRLRSPDELAGMNANEFVDGLTVEQHRYYWPMRDLMKEEVIVISSADMAPIDLPKEVYDLVAAEDLQAGLSPKPFKTEDDPWRCLQAQLDSGNKHALEYETYASSFYDTYMPAERRTLSSFDKAIEVRGWIHHALLYRPGWQRVTLHPDGYCALMSALDVFPDLLQLFIRTRIDGSGRPSQPPAQSYLATRVVGTLLEEKLHSFALEDDPNALSEILKLRQKYASDLQAFRAKMAQATNEWNLETDLTNMPGKVEGYIQTVRPEFEHTRRALSDKMRIPKLVLRRSGALISIGACAALGGAAGSFAGPLGTAAGAKAGGAIGAAASEALKAFFPALGEEVADKVKPKDVSIDKSLVYLFHAEEDLRRRHGR